MPGAWESEGYNDMSNVLLLAEHCVSHQLSPTMNGPSGRYTIEKSLGKKARTMNQTVT